MGEKNGFNSNFSGFKIADKTGSKMLIPKTSKNIPITIDKKRNNTLLRKSLEII